METAGGFSRLDLQLEDGAGIDRMGGPLDQTGPHLAEPHRGQLV